MPGTSAVQPDLSFLGLVEQRSEQPVSRCYQCRKCTNGCPLAFAMDWTPNQVMRLVQLGQKDDLLGSHTIWICAACQTCTARCPNQIDIARVMDTLRQLCLQQGARPAEPDVVKFHRAFLGSIRQHGRVYELGMVMRYKLSTGRLLDDMRLGWAMFRRGKLRLLPEAIRAKHEVRAMFAAANSAANVPPEQATPPPSQPSAGGRQPSSQSDALRQ